MIQDWYIFWSRIYCLQLLKHHIFQPETYFQNLSFLFLYHNLENRKICKVRTAQHHWSKKVIYNWFDTVTGPQCVHSTSQKRIWRVLILFLVVPRVYILQVFPSLFSISQSNVVLYLLLTDCSINVLDNSSWKYIFKDRKDQVLIAMWDKSSSGFKRNSGVLWPAVYWQIGQSWEGRHCFRSHRHPIHIDDGTYMS